jgi:hypothetical protein
MGHNSQASNDKYASELFRRVTWGLDLPLLIAMFILILVVWQTSDDLAHQYARRFFAGGSAISLILANTALLIYRIMMHRSQFQDRQKGTSFWEFLGYTISKHEADGGDAAKAAPASG